MTATAEDSIGNDVPTRTLVLVTAGRAGVGKSTVLNNLLGLKGKKAAVAKSGPRSVTQDVKCYEEEKYGIPVCIIDTPGLESRDLTSEQEQAALAKLASYGIPDLLLYCISLADRFQKDDDRIVETLTKTFGTEEDRGKIWRRAILVLTYGDVKLEGDEKEKRKLLQEYTEDFEKALRKAKVSDVSVKYMLSTKDINIEQDLESALVRPEIVGVPVGKCIATPQDWVFLLFTEVIKRCRMDAIPALLRLRGITQTLIAGLIRKVESVDKAHFIAKGLVLLGLLVGFGVVGALVGVWGGALIGAAGVGAAGVGAAGVGAAGTGAAVVGAAGTGAAVVGAAGTGAAVVGAAVVGAAGVGAAGTGAAVVGAAGTGAAVVGAAGTGAAVVGAAVVGAAGVGAAGTGAAVVGAAGVGAAGVGAVGTGAAVAGATGASGAAGTVGAIAGAVTGALGSIFGRDKLNETFELTVLAMIIEARLKAEEQLKKRKVEEQEKEETKVLKKRKVEEQEKEETKVLKKRKVEEQEKEETKVEEQLKKRKVEEQEKEETKVEEVEELELKEGLQKKIKELEEGK